MKKITRVAATTAVAVSLTLVGAQGAGAVTLYDHNNWTGDYFNAASEAANVGGMNDRASSVAAPAGRTFYEDAGYLGRSVTIYSSLNSLGAISTNLHVGETWSDRISSFQ